MIGKIYIVGLGVRGRKSVTSEALGLIEEAGLLIGGRRHLACFPEFEGKRVEIRSNLEEVATLIERERSINRQPKPIVVLASGDPNFFGIGGFLIKRFGKESIHIIPNISTMQEAFARIKESWNDARFLSLHGRDRGQKGVMYEVAEEIFKYEYKKIGVFTDPDNTPSKIAKALVDRGVSNYKAYVCEDLGTQKERLTEGTLAEIAEKSFSPLNVMMLIRDQKPEARSQRSKVRSQKETCNRLFGIPDSEFSHQKGMITKEEIRGVVLGKLSLREDSILWDIGAGSGAVSVEASRIAKKGGVYAVERKVEAFHLIEENKRRFNASNLTPVVGEAPEVLKDLPMPDSVFIGGNGGRLKDILIYVLERIKKGGVIVSNFTTVDNLSEAIVILKAEGMEPEVVEVSIARSETLSGKIHLKALNPVFIVMVRKD